MSCFKHLADIGGHDFEVYDPDGDFYFRQPSNNRVWNTRAPRPPAGSWVGMRQEYTSARLRLPYAPRDTRISTWVNSISVDSASWSTPLSSPAAAIPGRHSALITVVYLSHALYFL
ncbi:hypothetical protein J6590_051604 [Homalodisca vitripennis]|nr:hypothetical protein J6590_051604 [Homalodisca vitripennis]